MPGRWGNSSCLEFAGSFWQLFFLPVKMGPERRKIFLLTEVAPLCFRTAGGVMVGRAFSACLRLLALTSIKVASLAKKTPKCHIQHPPTKETQVIRESNMRRTLTAHLCSSWLKLLDRKYAFSQTGVYFLWCNLLSTPHCPLRFWWSGLQQSVTRWEIRSWVCSIIMSQTSANPHHRVSMGFWELCQFALAEDLALCNEMFSHSSGDMPTVWTAGYHGLQRDALVLGRQQDTQDLWMHTHSWHEILLSNAFRIGLCTWK